MSCSQAVLTWFIRTGKFGNKSLSATSDLSHLSGVRFRLGSYCANKTCVLTLFGILVSGGKNVARILGLHVLVTR